MDEPVTSSSYQARRQWLEEYFDRTAAQTWARLTSNAPVGRIRASVREGRERMRATLMSWLPTDLTGRRVLDAGCGTGAATIDLARRGAEVVAVDLSPTLVELAESRLPESLRAQVTFSDGDMLDDAWGRFDHVVVMDSVIHYQRDDMVDSLQRLAKRATRSLLFTFAPRTPLLAAMHAVGGLFPRGNRAPRIEPVAEVELRNAFAQHSVLSEWEWSRSLRIQNGFYTSQAVELTR